MRSLDAEQAIDYTKNSFESLLYDLDAVIDMVGGDLQARSIKVLRQGGILVTVTGQLPEGLGKAEGVRATRAGRAPVERLDEILRLVLAGQLKPVVGQAWRCNTPPKRPPRITA